MEQRLNMITLGVDDVGATKRFFADGLGWQPSGFESPEIVFFALPGTVLALFGRTALAEDVGSEIGPAGRDGVTIAWNGRSEAEVDAAYARAVSAGARPVKPPQRVFWGGYSSYVRIPGGHFLEIAFVPDFPMDDAGMLQLPPPKDA
ncbi:hypothetical protein GGD81_002863 [Rhodobium orientis]|uniref:Glyoxalase n=1 Tax=Rhodobium orientis TaxID=34017 RepID=A0A327JMN0_9HYPH|nr:VOC family protein [Rhodobium orientis]MBB4303811.1 hypothetical protein [Rhodobium orientis]MBK5947929.1 glyoxalase [Rhodobium orientis]RAI26112.1 glyoxalase [Rhodobium orientis]